MKDNYADLCFLFLYIYVEIYIWEFVYGDLYIGFFILIRAMKTLIQRWFVVVESTIMMIFQKNDAFCSSKWPNCCVQRWNVSVSENHKVDESSDGFSRWPNLLSPTMKYDVVFSGTGPFSPTTKYDVAGDEWGVVNPTTKCDALPLMLCRKFMAFFRCELINFTLMYVGTYTNWWSISPVTVAKMYGWELFLLN